MQLYCRKDVSRRDAGELVSRRDAGELTAAPVRQRCLFLACEGGGHQNRARVFDEP